MRPRPRNTRRPRLSWLLPLAVLPLVLTATPSDGAAGAARSPATTRHGSSAEHPAVLGVRRIGHSVDGRPIRAYHLGDPGAKVRAVVLGQMHGDEKAGIRVVRALRDGAPVTGVDLWVIPTLNPDGLARGTRGNARGVDLNRNFRYHWARLTGETYSGRHAFSEPESRAFRDFVDQVRPRYIVSFHQPLHGVGRDGERRPFQRRLARGLGLPIKALNCAGRCHGTMTEWYNAHHAGTAITVEFGDRPGLHYLRHRAADATLHAVLGSR